MALLLSKLLHHPRRPERTPSTSTAGTHTHLAVVRRQLERRLNEFHSAGYLLAIRSAQSGSLEDVERKGLELDDAYVKYREAILRALGD